MHVAEGLREMKNRGFYVLAITLLLVLIMACDTTNADPKDKRLQEPVGIGINNTQKFLKQAGVLNNNLDLYIRSLTPVSPAQDGSGNWNYRLVVHNALHQEFDIFRVKSNGCVIQTQVEIIDQNPVVLIPDNGNLLLNVYQKGNDYAYLVNLDPGDYVAISPAPHVFQMSSTNSQVLSITSHIALATEKDDQLSFQNCTNGQNCLVASKTKVISGNSYPGACLLLSINGEPVERKVVDKNGKWLFSVDGLQEGDNAIKIETRNQINEIDDLQIKIEYHENLFVGSGEKIPGYDTEIIPGTPRSSNTPGVDSNCTWYVSAAVKYWCEKLGLSLKNMPSNIQYHAPADWINIAEKRGFMVDDNPAPGAVVVFVWKKGGSHVGFIEKVEYKGSTIILTWSEEHYYPPAPKWQGWDPPEEINTGNGKVARWRQVVGFPIESTTGKVLCNSCSQIKFIHFFE